MSIQPKLKHQNTGNCQVCGSQQALDNRDNTLATHGYTLDYGYQDGTCLGSKNLPIQLSCDLVKEALEFAVSDQKSNLELIKKAKENIENLVPFVTRKEKTLSYDKKESYAWKPFTVCLVNYPDWSKMGYAYTVASAIKNYNNAWIWFLNTKVSNLERYIMWQTRRLEVWKVGPLLPPFMESNPSEESKKKALAILNSCGKVLLKGRSPLPSGKRQRWAQCTTEAEVLEILSQNSSCYVNCPVHKATYGTKCPGLVLAGQK